MKNLEIFDKDGKALHIADVISCFILEKEEEHKTTDLMIRSFKQGHVQIDEIEGLNNPIFRELESVYSNGL